MADVVSKVTNCTKWNQWQVWAVLLVLFSASNGQSSLDPTTSTTALPSSSATTTSYTVGPNVDRPWSYQTSASQPRPSYQKAPRQSSDRYSKQESAGQSYSVSSNIKGIASSPVMGTTTLLAIPVSASYTDGTPTVTLLSPDVQLGYRSSGTASKVNYKPLRQSNSQLYQSASGDAYPLQMYDPMQMSGSVSKPTYYGSSSIQYDPYFATQPSKNSNVFKYMDTMPATMQSMNKMKNSDVFKYMDTAPATMQSMYKMKNSDVFKYADMFQDSTPSFSSSVVYHDTSALNGPMMSAMLSPSTKSPVFSSPEVIIINPPKTISPMMLSQLLNSPALMNPSMMGMGPMMGHMGMSPMMGMHPMMNPGMMAMMMKKRKQQQENKDATSVQALLQKLHGLAKGFLSGGQKIKVISVKEAPALLHLLGRD